MIAKEIERNEIPVAFITAMSMMGKQIGANRIVTGTKIPHPCGDPNLFAKADLTLRKKIVESALCALRTDVDGPTIFKPDVTYTYG